KTSVNNQGGDISTGVISQSVTVPSGVPVLVNLGVTASTPTGDGAQFILVDSLLTTETLANDGASTISLPIAEITTSSSAQCQVLTNTSAQVRLQLAQTGTAKDVYIALS